MHFAESLPDKPPPLRRDSDFPNNPLAQDRTYRRANAESPDAELATESAHTPTHSRLRVPHNAPARGSPSGSSARPAPRRTRLAPDTPPPPAQASPGYRPQAD